MQLLSLTFPMVGNYGADPSRKDEFGLPKGFESDKIHASALIVRDYSPHYSHWDAKMARRLAQAGGASLRLSRGESNASSHSNILQSALAF